MGKGMPPRLGRSSNLGQGWGALQMNDVGFDDVKDSDEGDEIAPQPGSGQRGNASETWLSTDSEDDNDGNNENLGSIHEQIGLKWEFRNEIWENTIFAYNPHPNPFSSPRRGPTRNYRSLPSFQYMFSIFWTMEMLQRIVDETNRYANCPIDENGNIRGGPSWTNVTILELQAFLAFALYMRLNR